eukprot:PhM_4_TR13172/c0_g2_i1/m.15404/K09582/PDIA4, ERP72; protein disulfide-isomerase A4
MCIFPRSISMVSVIFVLFTGVVVVMMATTTAAASADGDGNDSVINLTSQNFDVLLGERAFVKFYAPWCGHCKALEPTWTSIAGKLKVAGVQVGRVDATQYDDLATRFEINAYPTLIFLDKKMNMYLPYEGPRSEDALLDFALVGSREVPEDAWRSIRAPGKDAMGAVDEDHAVVLTDTNFEHLTQATTGATTGDWFLFFHSPHCGYCQKAAPEIKKLAAKLRSEGRPVTVGKIDCSAELETRRRFNIKGYPTFVFLRQGLMYEYSGVRQVQGFYEFAADGGYRNSKSGGAPVPSPRGVSDQVQDVAIMLLKDLDALWGNKKAVLGFLFGIGVFVGAVLMVILTMCCAAVGGRQHQQKVRKVKKE